MPSSMSVNANDFDRARHSTMERLEGILSKEAGLTKQVGFFPAFPQPEREQIRYGHAIRKLSRLCEGMTYTPDNIARLSGLNKLLATDLILPDALRAPAAESGARRCYECPYSHLELIDMYENTPHPEAFGDLLYLCRFVCGFPEGVDLLLTSDGVEAVNEEINQYMQNMSTQNDTMSAGQGEQFETFLKETMSKVIETCRQGAARLT